MNINQITPIRYGQADVVEPEIYNNIPPLYDMPMQPKQNKGNTASILLGLGALAATGIAGIVIAKQGKKINDLENKLKNFDEIEKKLKNAETKLKDTETKLNDIESDIKSKTKPKEEKTSFLKEAKEKFDDFKYDCNRKFKKFKKKCKNIFKKS